jgi:vacuolar iron transporter family protein
VADEATGRREHRLGGLGWLRAGVLGANDGILTLSSLMIGIAFAAHATSSLLLVGCAALVSGAFAMAAGEYVSVSSQADFEAAELAVERLHLAEDAVAERDELAAIYVGRGLEPALAITVAGQLMARDALGAHARDELGFGEALRARPGRAALSSGLSFLSGGALPLLLAFAAPPALLPWLVAGASLLLLGALGALAAGLAGAPIGRGAARVALWGAASMAASTVLGLALGGSGVV